MPAVFNPRNATPSLQLIPLVSPTHLFNIRSSTFHVLCGLESFTDAAAWSAKDEREEECKREERRRGDGVTLSAAFVSGALPRL